MIAEVLRSWGCGCHAEPHPTFGQVLVGCAEHQAIWDASIRAYEDSHPDKTHTATCGCVSEEEMKRLYPDAFESIA